MNELRNAMAELASSMGGEQYIGELSHEDLVSFGIDYGRTHAEQSPALQREVEGGR